MQQRTLGRGGPAVSAIGYGAMGINLAYGPSDEATSIRAIQRAHDLGVTLFDTAELYGWGENEKVVGRAVKNSVMSSTSCTSTASTRPCPSRTWPAR